jgi:hypothetical protein
MKLGCCGSFPYLSADGVVKAVFVALVNVKGFAEERSGVLSKNKLLLAYTIVDERSICWHCSSGRTLANLMSFKFQILFTFFMNPKFN